MTRPLQCQTAAANSQESSFLAIIPAVIKSTVDSARLPIHNGTLAPVSAMQARLSLVTQMDTPANVAVKLTAFNLELYNPDSTSTNASTYAIPQPPTILSLAVPEQSLKGRSKLIIPEQDVTINNTAEFSKFLVNAFSANANVTIGVRAAATAKVAASSYPFTLDKNVSFAGLRSLAGLQVLSTAAVGNDTPATMLHGNMSLPNYSPLMIGLGDRVTYNVFSVDRNAGANSSTNSSEPFQIGHAIVPNLLLQPGNQTIDFEGRTDTQSVMDNLATLLHGMDKETGELGFSVVGDRAYVGNEHIPYLDDLMKNVKVQGTMSFCEAVKLVDVSGVPMDMMDLVDLDKVFDCMFPDDMPTE
ncbi:hypothetical protein BD289DRAFT_200454 [Coniella lustricola]|uniref:Uncharacterized protein n=1 Tax=Coniella lustricola TaxID=2025994 RepID=A0A2T2ZSJ4_9PEZI|nr:hypothetical protein BD289DRAFT_200454 [Coniella lustricola]